MIDYQVPEDAFINSIIGEGTRLSGEFDLNGLLRIDGDFCGTVRTKGKVLVGKNGRAECTIHAGTVVIGGVVRGNIQANERVVILSTGIVLGNIQTPRFIVEEGVVLHGNCRIEQAAQPAESVAAAAAGAADRKPDNAAAPAQRQGPTAAKAPPAGAPSQAPRDGGSDGRGQPAGSRPSSQALRGH